MDRRRMEWLINCLIGCCFASLFASVFSFCWICIYIYILLVVSLRLCLFLCLFSLYHYCLSLFKQVFVCALSLLCLLCVLFRVGRVSARLLSYRFEQVAQEKLDESAVGNPSGWTRATEQLIWIIVALESLEALGSFVQGAKKTSTRTVVFCFCVFFAAVSDNRIEVGYERTISYALGLSQPNCRLVTPTGLLWESPQSARTIQV